MACAATLKRPMDFDRLMSPVSPKRRRKDAAPPPPLPASHSQHNKRRRCVSPSSSQPPAPKRYLCMEPSPFAESPSSAGGASAEQLLSNIKQEYRRIHRVKQHPDGDQQQQGCCSPTESPSPLSIASAFSGMMLQGGGGGGGAVSPTAARREQPLLTLRQVRMICERLLKEREEKVREEYEETLSSKLAEQYDTFVKFTQDQWMRQFGERHISYIN